MLPKELDDDGLRARLAAFGEDHVDEIVALYRETFSRTRRPSTC